jgi:Plasmid pRiA4b ORF-3-like protein
MSMTIPQGLAQAGNIRSAFERTLPLEAERFYPVCMGGVGAAPPEHCGGPNGLAEFRELFTPRYILHRLAGILDDGPTEQGIAELRHLRPWITLHQFDRRAVNRQLQPEPPSMGRRQGERDENPDPHYHPV